MKKIIILIIFCLLVSGCNSNYISLNDIGIVSSMFVDKDKNDYITYIEVYKEEKNKKNTFFVKGKGSTIKDAINDASLRISRKLYFVHINAVVFSENAVKNNTKDIANYLVKKVQVNSNYYLLITDNIDNIIKSKNQDNVVLGEKINGIINYSDNNGALLKYDFFDMLYSYTNNIDLIVNKISANKDYLYIKDAYIFRKDNIVSLLKEDEIKLYNIIKENNNIFLKFNYNNNYYELKIDEVNVKYKFDNKIYLNIDIKANLDTISDKLRIDKNNVLESISKNSELKLNKDFNELFKKLKSNQSDVFGINNLIYKYKYGSKLDFYKDDTSININVKISKKGLIQIPLGGNNE